MLPGCCSESWLSGASREMTCEPSATTSGLLKPSWVVPVSDHGAIAVMVRLVW